MRSTTVELRRGTPTSGVAPPTSALIGALAARQRRAARIEALADDVEAARARTIKLRARLRRRAVPARVIRGARRARCVQSAVIRASCAANLETSQRARRRNRLPRHRKRRVVKRPNLHRIDAFEQRELHRKL